MKKTTRKRNPQDATLRNVRALKKRVENLEQKYKDLNEAFLAMIDCLFSLKRRVDKFL